MRCAIGQDSHKFEKENSKKLCVLGGVTFPEVPGLAANSDGDVVLHALCNAISGITCNNILGEIADKMCGEGITDSSEYVRAALEDLGDTPVIHVSFSIEAARPKLAARIPEMRESISELLNIAPTSVGITATTGEGLTSFGEGEGIFVTCIITTE